MQPSTPTRASPPLSLTCYAQFSGLAAGFIAGGTVADAVSTAGWNSALRKQRKKG